MGCCWGVVTLILNKGHEDKAGKWNVAVEWEGNGRWRDREMR